jgi:hypothetical protein
MHKIGLKVPGFGKIAAMRKFADSIEREYLLIDHHNSVAWLSHSDIQAILDANK